MFRVIATALNQLFKNFFYTMQDIRDMAAEELGKLSTENFKEFVIDLLGAFPPQWQSSTGANAALKHLQNLIKSPGDHYWGETGTLRNLLLNAPFFRKHQIGFAVIFIRKKPAGFRPPTEKEKAEYIARKRPVPKEVASTLEPRVETTLIRRQDTKYLIFMHCIDNRHWLLLGYAPHLADAIQKAKANPSSPTTHVHAPIASTFPIDSFPKPLFPFIKET
jgi:hypothetical protein